MWPAESIPLWPEQPPEAGVVQDGPSPTLTAFWPSPEQASGAAMIVCPGGGYAVLADHEADPVAQWLQSLGIAAFVLRYRLHPYVQYPAMLLDAARALRVLRAHAAAWRIDPQRIGMLGFSAGGHLASLLATQFDAGDADAADPIQQVSSRPDLAVLIYPVITLQAPHGHSWCRECLLGSTPDPALLARLSSQLQVTPRTPPIFLVHTADDDVRCENSLLMAQALSAAGVPFELHLYERGGHGYGLAADDPVLGTWPQRCADWLAARGCIERISDAG
jgi:acetyl esterase/lipase